MNKTFMYYVLPPMIIVVMALFVFQHTIQERKTAFEKSCLEKVGSTAVIRHSYNTQLACISGTSILYTEPLYEGLFQ